MRVTKFNVVTEVRKALKGRKTKVGVYTLFQLIAPAYLETFKAEKPEPTGEDALPKFKPVKSTFPRVAGDYSGSELSIVG